MFLKPKNNITTPSLWDKYFNCFNLIKLNCDYTKVKKFYEWFGDPSKPKLPWESIEGYTQEIFENLKYVKENL